MRSSRATAVNKSMEIAEIRSNEKVILSREKRIHEEYLNEKDKLKGLSILSSAVASRFCPGWESCCGELEQIANPHPWLLPRIDYFIIHNAGPYNKDSASTFAAPSFHFVFIPLSTYGIVPVPVS